ncbi:hypothetical protein Pint_22060 [Pistacia integerrima]|uniref:Uncharacterized protein n=1 Tax=Pistacia integerrima TaxID=434235 RepID=A0ACC0YL81_9ROSI|nr:hypothetical protein Pint_22060 [Pistacia integerrima]
MATINFHASIGQSNPSTIRLRGSLVGRSVEVLVDGGSTHKFLQERVASHLGIPIVVSQKFTILTRNGDILHCSGMCSAVPLELDGHCFSVDLLVLLIHGADVVLGAQWLATLEPMVMDYSMLTLSSHK